MISVIVATRNRANLLARTLAALALQDWPRDEFEIVVVDNASDDDTAAQVRRLVGRSDYPTLVLLREERPGKSYAVNTGVMHARGDLLAFTDDDVLPDRGWLRALHGAVTDTAADFVAGRIEPLWEAPPPAWLGPGLYGVLAIPDNGLVRQEVREGLNDHLMPIGANMAVRRAVVARVGGWRTDLGKLGTTSRSGEDHEFFLRMLRSGCRGVYEPTALVAHTVPASRLHRGYFRRWLFDNGQIVAGLEREFPTAPRRLLGVAAYRWRDAAADAAGLLRGCWRRDERECFARQTRLLWFAGFLRGAWLGSSSSHQPAHALRLEPQPALAHWERASDRGTR